MSYLTNIVKLRALTAILLIALLAVACGKAELPNLIEAPKAITPTPKTESSAEELIDVSTQSDLKNEADTSFDMDDIATNGRGISDESIKIAVIKSGDVFQDIEIGVEARVFRSNENGGINSRELEIIKVVDDFGREEDLKLAVKEIVDLDVFAVVLLSTATSPEVTDILAENNMPFFGQTANITEQYHSK